MRKKSQRGREQRARAQQTPQEPFVLQLDQTTLAPDVREQPSQPNASTRRRKKRLVKQKISPLSMALRLILAFALVGGAVAVSLVIILSVQDVMGFSKSQTAVDIHVKKGDSVSTIAKNMQEVGVIRSDFLFRAYISTIAKREIVVNYGKYTLRPNMTYEDMLKTLESGGKSSDIRLVVVEGYTVQQIADLLEEQMICPADEFIEQVNHGTWLKKSKDGTEVERFYCIEQLKKAADVDQRPFRLEGYLFPDTYQLATNTPATEVVAKFLSKFDEKFDTHMRYITKNSKYLLDDMIKIASIVESEASGIDEQMPRVASVYWNRLNNPSTYPKMQADPTSRYAREVLAPLGTAQEVLTAYDTYQSAGLPLGPISNPGIKAIEAALKPADEDFTFFVTSRDMQTFYYSKSYEKHMENIEKAQKNAPE